LGPKIPSKCQYSDLASVFSEGPSDFTWSESSCRMILLTGEPFPNSPAQSRIKLNQKWYREEISLWYFRSCSNFVYCTLRRTAGLLLAKFHVNDWDGIHSEWGFISAWLLLLQYLSSLIMSLTIRDSKVYRLCFHDRN